MPHVVLDVNVCECIGVIEHTGFSILPLSMSVPVGRETTFPCEHPNAVGISWVVNGTALRSQPDLHNTFRESSSGSLRSLTVTALSKYNSTMIECVALLSNNQPTETAPTALLHVQGTATY